VVGGSGRTGSPRSPGRLGPCGGVVTWLIVPQRRDSGGKSAEAELVGRRRGFAARAPLISAPCDSQRAPRTSRPGRAPVSTPSRRVTTPLTIVAPASAMQSAQATIHATAGVPRLCDSVRRLALGTIGPLRVFRSHPRPAQRRAWAVRPRGDASSKEPLGFREPGRPPKAQSLVAAATGKSSALHDRIATRSQGRLRQRHHWRVRGGLGGPVACGTWRVRPDGSLDDATPALGV
jgi:hypothetical protein